MENMEQVIMKTLPSNFNQTLAQPKSTTKNEANYNFPNKQQF